MTKTPTKKSIKLKVGAATGAPATPAKPGPPKPEPKTPDTVTIAGQTFTMEQFKAAFDKTVADQYEAATKAILDMPAHVEMEMQKHFGVDKIGLLAHAKKFAPKSKTNLQALMAGTGKTNPTKAAVVKSPAPATMHLDQKVVGQALQAKHDQNLQAGLKKMGVNTIEEAKAKVHGTKEAVTIAAPAVDKPVKPRISDKMEKVTNPATNSVFDVIGRLPNGLRLSTRFWFDKDESKGKGNTVLKFRLRLGDQNPVGAPDYEYVQNVLAYASEVYPGYGFYGTPIRNSEKQLVYPHVSIEGVLEFPQRPSKFQDIMDTLVGSDFMLGLFDTVKAMDVELTLNAGDFVQYIMETVEDIMLAYAETPKEQPAHKLRFKLGALGPGGKRLMDSDYKEPKTTKKDLQALAGL